MTDAKLEELAIELASRNFVGLSRDQIREQMNVLLGGLDRIDADMVVEHAKSIAREQAGAKMKEAAALEAFGRRKGVL